MAHFARIDKQTDIVLHVDVVDDSIATTENNGIEFLSNFYFYKNQNWINGVYFIETSYNNNLRKNYAGIGYKYDEVLDAFIPVKPYNSWILNESTCRWIPPIDYPKDDKIYSWDESSVSWVELKK